MKHLGFFSGIVVALLLILSMIYFWSEAKPGSKTQSLVVQAQDLPRGGERGGRGGDRAGGRGGAQGDRGGFGGGPGGAMGDRGGFGGGPGGFMGMPNRTQGQGDLVDFVEVLALANLEPNFELVKAQKESIKQVRDGFAAATEKWRKDSEPQLAKITEEIRQMGQEASREAFRGLVEKRQAIATSAPSGQAAIDEIRKILTPDQIKLLDEQFAARKAAADERRRQAEAARAAQGGQGQGAPGAPAQGGQQRGQGAGQRQGGGANPTPAPTPAPVPQPK